MESQSEIMKVIFYGYYFEDITVGDKFRHGSRTITETDKAMFLYVSGLNAPLFIDEEFAKRSPLKKRLIPGPLTLSIIIGLAEEVTRGRDFAALGIDKIRFVKPVSPGDTITAYTEIIDKRETSKADRGIISQRHWGTNQNGELVIEFERSLLLARKVYEFAE